MEETRQDLQKIVEIAEDLADTVSIQDRTIARLNREIAGLREHLAGQADLPLPGETAAPAAADPAPTRGALLGYCDAVEDSIDRADAEAAKAALRNLRTALQEL